MNYCFYISNWTQKAATPTEKAIASENLPLETIIQK